MLLTALQIANRNQRGPLLPPPPLSSGPQDAGVGQGHAQAAAAQPAGPRHHTPRAEQPAGAATPGMVITVCGGRPSIRATLCVCVGGGGYVQATLCVGGVSIRVTLWGALSPNRPRCFQNTSWPICWCCCARREGGDCQGETAQGPKRFSVTLILLSSCCSCCCCFCCCRHTRCCRRCSSSHLRCMWRSGEALIAWVWVFKDKG